MSVMPRRVVSLAILLFLGDAVSGCAAGPEEAFERDAAPVLEARCATAACHGVAPGDRWPDDEGFFVRIDSAGRLATLSDARAAALSRVVTTESPFLSSLLRVPLGTEHGGGPHAGGELFLARDDPSALAIARWIDSEPDGSGGEDVALDPLETLFGDTVLPVLVSRCGFAGCHGPTEEAFTAFAVRPDPVTGRFAPADVRDAHRVARKHLDLWSDDARRARLLRKPLGEEESGIVHRGGFGTFFPEAPPGRPYESTDLAAILAWARAERAASGVADGAAPSALLWVAGPPSPRAPWRIERGATGSDLWITPWPVGTGERENLTAALHPDGPVEVRDPAVSHDATTVAFAMRRGHEERFALFLIDLRTREARQLTPPEAPGSFVQPVFAPDGHVIAAWDGHGEAGAYDDGIAPELVAVAPDGSIERLTFTPAPEVAPAFLAAGKTRGTLIFGTRRRGPLGPEAVLFRFPLCHDPDLHGEPEYHVQFGASIAPRAPLVARDLPDGRQVLVVLDEVSGGDDRGRLAILDRSLGPALPEDAVASASMGGYRDPIAWLGDGARFRDPFPTPDGRVLASDDAIWAITIADGPGGAALADRTLLLEEPGTELRSPVAVFPRPPEDTHLPTVDPTARHGYIAFRDVGVLEAIYGRAAPHGPREPRETLSAIRLVEWAGTRARDLVRYADGTTSAGLSDRAPARVLAEVPLAADRSAWIRIPARRPLSIQLIDARGMSLGSSLDRWYFAEGGEIVPGGTNVETYGHACSGCHGSMSGQPEDAAAPAPDALSSASVTLARYEGRDRRRPLPPVEVPDEGRTVDWVSVIGPAFAESCAASGCHGGASPAAGIALDGRAGERADAGYEALLEGWIDREELRARRSALVERLLGEELEATSPVAGECPPGGADDALVRDVIRWIEIGAFYDVGGAR